jgi:hypothetical protein
MNIKKMALVTCVAASFSMTTHATDLVAADQSIATDLCLTAASGNRAAMVNQMKASGKSMQFIAKNIHCNGENILAFVDQHGKKSQNMLKVLDRSTHEVSITDIAKNTLKQ